jgi:hypothetical protein
VRASARTRYTAATRASKLSRLATDALSGHLTRMKAGRSAGRCSS